jgi:nitrite reductase/ring-hydroxylating ferredoxin subunit
MPPTGDREFHPRPIDVAGLRRGALNARDVGDGVAVVVIADDRGLTVLRDVCPHMGGPLSEGSYCREDRTLQCPWHGYVFSLETGEFKLNPVDPSWDKVKARCRSYKPENAPRYRLPLMEYELRGDRVYVRRPGGGSAR